MTKTIQTPTPLVRAHLVKGFDDRRAKLQRRIKLLTSLGDDTMISIAADVGMKPDLFSHLLSGRRNSALSLHIDEIEAVVAKREEAAKQRGVRLPR